MTNHDVLCRFFAAKQHAGWLALSALDDSLTRGFGTRRVATLRGRRLFLTIGGTGRGRDLGLSEQFRHVLEGEGIRVLTTRSTSARRHDALDDVGFDIGMPPGQLARVLEQVFASVASGRQGMGRLASGDPIVPATGRPPQWASLDDFAAALSEILGHRRGLRPFVCDGSPLACEVFVVGYKPTTTLDDPFWPFWRPDTGFDKAAWFDAYVAARETAPLGQGKSRRPAVSATRRRMQWLAEALAPVRCLETNVFARAGRGIGDGSAPLDADVLEFLLHAVRPRCVLLHGKEPHRWLEGQTGRPVELDRVVTCQVAGVETAFVPVAHLSRGWSEARAREMGRRLREACLAPVSGCR